LRVPPSNGASAAGQRAGAMVKVIGAAETPLRAGADAERRPLREMTKERVAVLRAEA
jgi:hypothetical protein